jgi:thiamine biosynthesis lipoprotein
MNARALGRAQKIITATFEEVNALYNQWNPESEISALNRLPANTSLKPSTSLYRLLQLIDEIVTLSDGRYDPTVEPLSRLWLAKMRQGEIPAQAHIDSLAPAIGWEKIHLEQGFFWKDHEGVQISLDSISKGLCVDLLTERLVAAGYRDLLVEWGGEIRACGRHPEGRPWRVYIRRLQSLDPDEAIAHIDLEDAALATSGDYLQQWTMTREGTTITYFHILNPQTLSPLTVHADSVASATVLAPSCVLADALATATICWDDIHAAKLWAEQTQERFPKTLFWLVARTPKVTTDVSPKGFSETLAHVRECQYSPPAHRPFQWLAPRIAGPDRCH